MQRLIIVGGSGTGKSTLAQVLARRLELAYTELDSLYWGPDWTESSAEDFRRRVAVLVARDGWVLDGNYGKVRDLLWGRADVLIWLDYPLGLTLWRLLKRTLQRIAQRTELWQGNRETWRGAFLSRDSLFLHLLRTHHSRRRAYRLALDDPAYAHLQVIRLRSPNQTAKWLEEIVAERDEGKEREEPD